MSASKIASVRRSRTAQRFALENRCQYILGMIGGTNEEREVLFAKARVIADSPCDVDHIFKTDR